MEGASPGSQEMNIYIIFDIFYLNLIEGRIQVNYNQSKRTILEDFSDYLNIYLIN